ncbi:MAG: diacylglycerol kinase [Deltaproteobacteria bacterium]|nr:diacylglycerol kinase [Deltaproteobacteria bacterium]
MKGEPTRQGDLNKPGDLNKQDVLNKPGDLNKPKGFIGSLNCAIEGILWAVKTQRHMLFHLVAAILVLVGALFLRLTLHEFALLALAITLVLFAELVNTAIEVVVDLVSPDFHPLAQRAKDVAAGAVLLASAGALVLGYLALSRFFFTAEVSATQDFMRTTGNVAVISVVVVVLLVILAKARVGRGTPLHGGMPSGHAGIAFSIATSVAFSEVGLLVILLAWLLAALVAHSRVLLGIHNLTEVVAGSLLGIMTTLAMHLAFH